MARKDKIKRLARHLQKTFAEASAFDHGMDEEAWRDHVAYEAPSYSTCRHFVVDNLEHIEKLLLSGSDWTSEQWAVCLFAGEVRKHHQAKT